MSARSSFRRRGGNTSGRRKRRGRLQIRRTRAARPVPRFCKAGGSRDAGGGKAGGSYIVPYGKQRLAFLSAVMAGAAAGTRKNAAAHDATIETCFMDHPDSPADRGASEDPKGRRAVFRPKGSPSPTIRTGWTPRICLQRPRWPSLQNGQLRRIRTAKNTLNDLYDRLAAYS